MEKNMSLAAEGNKVKVHYTGTFDDGETFDSSQGQDPLEFEVGGGQVIPGFEQAVVGMKVGESKKVKISETDAYGSHNPEMVIESSLAQFEEGMTPEVGQQFQTEMEDGQPVLLTVIEVEGEKVIMDANHPMAGKDLNFEIELVEIAG
jgi:peptidylprolyl isomerase